MFLNVDDNQAMQQQMIAMLSGMGISDIKAATSGIEALVLVDQFPQQIDVMIFDLCAPQIDGIQLMRELAARNFSGRLVIISGMDKSVLRGVLEVARMYSVNVIGALPKPVNAVELGKVLQRSNSVAGKADDPFRHLQLDDLFDAVSNRQITPHYQPLVDIRSGKVVGVEALARWQHCTLGAIPPDIFIPMAEREGVIYSMTSMLLDQALGDIRQLKQLGYPLNLSFNLSAALLGLKQLPDYFLTQLEKKGVTPDRVTLEITESVDIVNDFEAMATLHRLRMMGFKLAIDDFGTGYASINNLLNMPFTEMKIDRAFVTGAFDNEIARILLGSCLKLSHDLGMTVVCEGVESEYDLNLVRALDGTVAQGRLICEPKPVDELICWLKGTLH